MMFRGLRAGLFPRAVRANSTLSPELNRLLQQTIDASESVPTPSQPQQPSTRPGTHQPYQPPASSRIGIDEGEVADVPFDPSTTPSMPHDPAVAAERQLFADIFKSLKKTRTDAVGETMESIRASKPPAIKSAPIDVQNQLSQQTREALQPSIAHINAMQTSPAIVAHFDRLVARWHEISKLKKLHGKVFLNHLLKTVAEDDRTEFLDEVRQQAAVAPEDPPLNVFTLPILVNAILHRLAFDLYHGQLAISLYNSLKYDVGLYSIACNQHTYNEMLGITWIYNAKGDLYPIEVLVEEMRNNGFPGNLETFNVVQQIVIDYHNLRMGKLQGINLDTGVPLWSAEDDARAQSLESTLKAMAHRLGKSMPV
ncbi:hypothetical protein DICA2_A06766 [Diutina catenulata]